MFDRLFRIKPEPRDPAPLENAKRKTTELEVRAHRVVPELIARRNRNHWGETVARITRGEIAHD